MVRNPPPRISGERRRTWVSQTERWIQRFQNPIGKCGSIFQGDRGTYKGVSLRTAVAVTREDLLDRWLAREEISTKAGMAYVLAESASVFPPKWMPWMLDNRDVE